RQRSIARLRPMTERSWAWLQLMPATLAGQGRGMELHLGRWYNGNRADVYEFRTSSALGGGGGPFTHGFGASVLVNDSLGRRRAFYGIGYELQAWRGRATLGPYALAGVALGLSTDLATPELAAQGSVDVVQTAIESLGTPYIWGGTADNGFDCSGLIQYAYGQHGIRLPRMSRDQARAGAEVAPVVDALRPGDVLLFSARPGAGVTHVGMYVGELKFIHSSNRGVKLSRLDPQDPEGAYWLDRLVGARRIIP